MHTKAILTTMFWRYFFIILGFAFAGAGLLMTVLSQLGTNPWTVLAVGATNYLPFTVGQMAQIIGLSLIIFSYALGIRAKIGTFMNMFFVGLFYDLWNITGIFPGNPATIGKYVYILSGVFFFAIGSGLYINARLGTGPRDSLMYGLHNKLGWSIRFSRGFLEVTVLSIGFFLGGPVGIGTLIFALLIGPSVQFSLQVFNNLMYPLVGAPFTEE